MSPIRISLEEARKVLLAGSDAKRSGSGDGDDTKRFRTDISHIEVIYTDVFIAGSGPIGCAYARELLEDCNKDIVGHIYMAEIGAQESPTVGVHQKNAVKYQNDLDSFVHVIQGALQPISIPPRQTFTNTLAGSAWVPPPESQQPGAQLIIMGQNPQQIQSVNLRGAAVTRAVGGMATHWTCASPIPHTEETAESPIPRKELEALLNRAKTLLKVDSTVFDNSIRHTTIKSKLTEAFPDRNVQSIPLAVQRHEIPHFVTWSGSDTILGEKVNDKRFFLRAECRVTRLLKSDISPDIMGVIARDLKTDNDFLIMAKAYIIACGSVCTPQLLYNSGIRPLALGRYLSEQSMAFCQIVLSRDIVESIENTTNPEWRERIRLHKKKHPLDPLPIPFRDLEPQVMIPYSPDFPWHCQIHRDAFSYGEIGSRSDPRVIVDLRLFGKADVVEKNSVEFCNSDLVNRPVHVDLYGLPQATRTREDDDRDQRMMLDMTTIANSLGGYLPGSYPQFMEPGAALHITGTTRVGKDPNISVADANSKVWDVNNLWVGGNGVIPDSTASNPTLTSIAYALKSVDAVIEYLRKIKRVYSK